MKLSTVILPSMRWSTASEVWQRAERIGFHAGYTYDHLSWRSFRERPWFTMIPTLVAAASVTTSMRLGPLVTSPNFRHPLVLAKDLLALDDISRGRLNVGIGSGGTGFDATVFGGEPWTPRERHARFVEFAHAIDTLLREPATTLDGAYYPIVDSRQVPGPVQLPRPPIYLSALGPKSLALCAEIADGWVSFAESPGATQLDAGATTAANVTRLNEQLDRRGRSASSLWRLYLHFGENRHLESLRSFIDWSSRLHELGFDEVVIHWPVPDSIFDIDWSTFEEIATAGREVLESWG